MQIPVEKIIEKMSRELALATQSTHDAKKIRQHMLVIQSLCELILDEDVPAVNEVQSVHPSISQSSIQTMNGLRVEGNRVIESESDSLLDF